MASGRDDFIIAIRSAFLKKSNKQQFSLLALIIFSIVSITSNRLISILNVDASNKKIVYLKSFIFVLIGMSILL